MDKTLKIVIIVVCVSMVLLAIVGWTFLSFLLSQKNIGGQENEAQEPQINEAGYKRIYDLETGEWLGVDVTLQYLGSDSMTVTIEEDCGSPRSIVVQPSETFVVYVSRYGSAIVRYNGLRQLILLPFKYRP